jgi:hypothetical protein
VPSDPAAAQLLHDRIEGLLDPSADTLSRLVSKEVKLGGAAGSEAALAIIADEVLRSPADNRDAAWTVQINEVIGSIRTLHRDTPELVSTRVQEEAVLRLTLALVASYEATDRGLVKYAYDVPVENYMFHIADPGIVELASAYPSKWERIADLMMEHGLDRPEEIRMVLDGTVPTAFASGVL